MHPQLETVVLTETIRRFKTLPRFFLDKVFPLKTTSTWQAEWTEQDETQEIARFQGRGRERTMEAQMARTIRRESYLHVRPGGFVPSVDMKNLRRPGSSDQSEAFGLQLVNDEIEAMRRRCDRTMEWIGAAVLQAASVNVTVDGATVALTGLQSTNVVTAGAWWGTASVDILQDIEVNRTIISRESGEDAQFMLMASSVGRTIIENTTIQNLIKETTTIDKIVVDGVIQRFNGLDVYYYDKFYKPRDGTFTRIWDDNLVLFGCYANVAQSNMLIGPPEDTDMQAAGDGIGAKSWKSEDPDGINFLADASFYPHLGNRHCFLTFDITP